jgi:thioredoxin
MKKLSSTILVAVLILLFSCKNGTAQEDKTNLTAKEFAEALAQHPNAKLIDVRTPEEFNNGHLANATNYNWNGSHFTDQIEGLDRDQPVYVYCMAGSRSAAAATKMRQLGFKHVYEMEGGIMKWRAASLPEVSEVPGSNNGMSLQQFQNLLKSDKMVLVDFYADWCMPCKKIKPYLDKIGKERADNLVIIRINVDEHRTLCNQLKIDAIPVLQLYKQESLVWNNIGYIKKDEIEAALDK